MKLKTITPASFAQAASVPALEAPAPTVQPDTHAGRGGLYELFDGQRVLIERTDDQAQTPPAP